MFRRFIEWLKRLFSQDSDTKALPAPEDASQEVPSSDKIDVISCEVVSISFDDEHEQDPEEITDFEI